MRLACRGTFIESLGDYLLATIPGNCDEPTRATHASHTLAKARRRAITLDGESEREYIIETLTFFFIGRSAHYICLYARALPPHSHACSIAEREELSSYVRDTMQY